MQHNAAYNTGVVIGMILGVAVPVISIILCSLSFGNRRANIKCLLSLIIFMASWLMGAVSSAIQHFLPGQRIQQVAVGMLALLGMITSIVLAIIGLAEHRRRRYRAGKKRAILTLCLNGLFAVLIALMICKAQGYFFQPSRATGLSETFTSPENNFQMVIPSPWVKLPHGSLVSTSVLSMIRSDPPMCMAVFVTTPGVETPITNESLAATALGGLRSATPGLDVLNQAPARLHEMDGIRMNYDAMEGNAHFTYAHWLTFYNGRAYQLLAWSPVANRNALYAEVQGLFDDFTLLDPKKEAHQAGFRPLKDYTSLSNGFKVHIEGSSWTRPIARLFEIAPDAEYGAADKGENSLLVMPLPLGNHEPSVDYLAGAFLSRFQVQYPGDSIIASRPVTRGPMTGLEITFTRTHNGFQYRSIGDVLKRKGFACMVVVTTGTLDGSMDAELADGLSRVEFSDSPVALDPNVMTTREKKSRADLFNEIGLEHYRDKHYKAAGFNFKEARTLAPTNQTYALNVTDAIIETGAYRDALDDLNAYLKAREPIPKLRLRLAYLEAETGDVDAAIKDYGTVFDAGLSDDNYFGSYVGLLEQSKQHDAAIAKTLDYQKQHDSISNRLVLAHAYRTAGRTDDALKTLREQEDKYPENSQIGVEIAETLLAAGRYAEAETNCARLISTSDPTALAYFLQGRAQYGLKHYREAKTLLEAALKLEPSSTEAKSFLDHISAMLGEGSNTVLKTAIDPVSVPPEILSSISGTAVPAASGYGAYYRSCVAAIEYAPGREFKTTNWRRIKILDETGVTSFSAFELPFNPLSEEVYINDLTVRDASGAIVSTGTASDYYVMDDTRTGHATQAKMIHIPVSGVRPGCEINLIYTRRDTSPDEEFRFTPYLFSKPLPVVYSALFLRAPEGSFKCESSGTMKMTKTADGAYWSVAEPAIYRWEPMQVAVENFLPGIWLSDPKATWKGVGSQYLESINDRLAPDDAIRKAASENTGKEKGVPPLARFVQQDFSYTAIEFGRRARVPNSPATTLSNRYGDCKDHAVLLRALLEASGIPAQLALVNAQGEVRADMPSLDQFNHMILYVPSLPGGGFVDCTDKDSDITHDVPYGLAGKKALLLDAKNSRLVTIPDYPAGGNELLSTRTVKIENGSDAVVTESLKLRGATAAYLRGIFRRTDAGNRQTMIQRELSSTEPAIEVRDLQLTNLDDTTVPLELKIAYVVKGKFHKVGEELIGQLPAIWERMLLATTPSKERLSPFQVMIPLSVASDVSVTSPGGFVADPGTDTSFKKRFVTCTTSSQKEAGGMNIACSINEPSGRFGADQYAAYQESIESALAGLERNVVLKPAAK